MLSLAGENIPPNVVTLLILYYPDSLGGTRKKERRKRKETTAGKPLKVRSSEFPQRCLDFPRKEGIQKLSFI